MENLEYKIKNRLSLQLQSIQNKNLYPFMDWVILERIVTRELLPNIIKTISEFLEEKEKLDEKLISRLNQIAFRNDPGRDKKIIELYNQNTSKAQIAKAVGMSRFGITKALRRLGFN